MNPNQNETLWKIASLQEQVDKLSQGFGESNRVIKNLLTSQLTAPAYPSSNLLYNGELGHSINSWIDTSYVTNNRAYCCIVWYSNDAPTTGQTLVETYDPFSANTSLKSPANTLYDANYSDWDSQNGIARLNGLKTLDTPLPTNFIDATTPLARASLIAAKRNQYIEIPDDCLMYAGIWDNTSGQRDFIFGTFGFTAELVGTPASTIEKRYKIVFISDRGFTYVSPEITISNAPADGNFTTTAYVQMSWKQQPGQLEVQIYEYVPSSSAYRLLEVVSAGTSYIHLGNILKTVGGYPTGTSSDGRAIYYTKEGEMPNLATDGISAAWDTLNFPMGVPADYDKGNTTDKQWLRIGLSKACNLFVEGITTNGTTTITAPANVFESAYASLLVGLTVEVYDSTDVLLTTTTVSSRTSDTQIVLAASIATGTNRKIRIVGGGFHGILVDKIHLGYHQNTAYAPNPNDARYLQGIAMPASSSQGGVGSGGSDGGLYNCVVGDTLIKTALGERREIQYQKEGASWDSAEFKPNVLIKLRRGFAPVREVISANGLYLKCTDTERFVTNVSDHSGTPLHRLRVGDSILTEIDGKIEKTTIKYISPLLPQEVVYTPSLSHNRLFIAGKKRYKMWEIFLSFFGRKKEKGGFVLHNRKLDEELYSFY